MTVKVALKMLDLIAGYCFFLAIVLPTSLVDGQCLRANGTCVDVCPRNNFIYNDECVESCPEGWIVADDNVTCLNCPVRSQDGACMSRCPWDTYPDLTNGSAVCLPCYSLCFGCSGPGLRDCYQCSFAKYNNTCVTHCPEDFVTYGGMCVPTCPSTTLFLPEKKACYEICPESHPYVKWSRCTNFCEKMIHRKFCIDSCPNGTMSVADSNICFDKCPETHPLLFASECIQRCPRSHRYSLEGECISDCPTGMKFVPGERVCLDRCPGKMPLAFNQVCMRRCPPGTYRIREENGFRCLPYVGLKAIAAVVTSLLVLLCVVFGIYMSKQYVIARKTEESVGAMVQASEVSSP